MIEILIVAALIIVIALKDMKINKLENRLNIKETENYGRIQFVIEIEKLRNQIEFLTKRDNKLQQIEQMFQNGQVDLSELSKLIKES